MSLLRPVVYGLHGFDRFTGLLVVLARDIRSALEWPLAGTIDPKSVSKTMNIRRGIIFAYVMCVTFLVAHIINGVIAEALSVPVGLVRPSPASDREAELRASVPAMVEHIRTSGLFPLPPDPIGISTAGPGGPGGRSTGVA